MGKILFVSEKMAALEVVHGKDILGLFADVRSGHAAVEAVFLGALIFTHSRKISLGRWIYAYGSTDLSRGEKQQVWQR